MKINDPAAAIVLRATILKLLSDDEVAKVSTAETASGLLEGEEFLDLGHLDRGVRRVIGQPLPMGTILARKSVHESTWKKVLSALYAG